MNGTVPRQGVPAPLPLRSRVSGMVFSPRASYVSVVAHGPWLDVLALTTAVGAGCLALLLGTQVGRQAWVDQAEALAEGWGRTLGTQEYAHLQELSRVARFANPAALLVVTPVMTAVAAALLFGVCNALVGRTATYRQVLAVVAHSGVISIVQQLFVMPLDYFRESLGSPLNLGAFFPMLNDTGFLATFLATVDLFSVWRVLVLAVGLSVLYDRSTRRFAVGLLSAYGVIGLLIATVKAVFTRGS